MNEKKVILANLRSVLNDWEALVADADETEANAPRRSDDWSIKDVVAHVMAWQQISIARLRAAELDAEPEYPPWLQGFDPFYAEEHTDPFNARIYQIYHDQPWPAVHAAWKKGFTQFIEMANAVSDDVLFDRQRYPWLRGYALAAVLEGSAEHHREHLAEVAGKLQ